MPKTNPAWFRNTSNLLHLQGFMIFFALAVVIIVTSGLLKALDTRELCLIAMSVILVSLMATACTAERKVFSVSFIYLLIFALFHGGVIVVHGLGLRIPAASESYFNNWFPTQSGRMAVVLVIVGMTTYVAGALLAIVTAGTGKKLIEKTSTADVRRKRAARLGMVLVLSSVIAWFLAVIATGGVALLQGSYLHFLSATEHLRLWRVYFAIGLGMVFLAAGEPSSSRRIGFAAFGLFAVAGFPLGLRGEVLFPLAATLAVSGMRRAPIAVWKAAILMIVLLSCISAIRQVRDVGVGQIDLTEVSFAPTEAIAEMGASIRPVVETVRWHEHRDEFILGQSYWAPIDRSLVYLLPGWSRPPVYEDDRLLSGLIQKRVGPIGFSVVAEAFHNFGTLGVGLVMGIIGFAFGRMDRWPADPVRQIACGVVMLPLLIHVRNAFTLVPMNLVTGYFLLACLVWSSMENPNITRRLRMGDVYK